MVRLGRLAVEKKLSFVGVPFQQKIMERFFVVSFALGHGNQAYASSYDSNRRKWGKLEKYRMRSMSTYSMQGLKKRGDMEERGNKLLRGEPVDV